ncbi:MAG: dTDP-4-dehydrorhamnose reductase [Peptococcaceae bacterium]|nr:dTDP-4-dehydrorhamnose reductase [Peptococcaceae bacterium]
MRILIAGAAGMLGRQMVKEYTGRGAEVFPLTRKDLDITSYNAIKKAFADISPQLVVNCAAYTNVDGAETEKEEAFAVNGLAPRLLALACRQYNAVLVHISTDYIFNGQSHRPYLVSDIPNPINAYGASKLMGEQGVKESGCSYYIVRTSWLFGPGGKNFVDTILKLAGERDTLKVVNDQQGSPTYTPDLARGVADLAGTGIYGTYHYTNSGVTTWYGFARKIIQTAGLKTKVEPCTTADFPRPARRPANSALDPFPIIQVLGYTPPSWEEAAEHYIKNHYKTKQTED